MRQVFGRRLSRWLTPKFPDRCVVCGADRPGHQARFLAGGEYGPFFFVLWFDDGKKLITAPACPGCVLGRRIRGLLQFAVSAAMAALAAWLLFWVAPRAPAADEFKILVVVLAALVPLLVWNRLFPPRFNLITAGLDGDICFHFCDAPYAAAFDALNHLPTPGPLPLDLSAEEVLPAGLDTSASPDRLADAPSIQDDRANPYRSLEDPRFRN